MIYHIIADLIVVIHLSFILFVMLGGFLVFRWKKAAIVHLLAVLWGTIVELFGLICPLTPLEYHFRVLAGQQGYSGGFIEHYLIPLIYPATLTRSFQYFLAALVIAVNVCIYGWILSRCRQKMKDESG